MKKEKSSNQIKKRAYLIFAVFLLALTLFFITYEVLLTNKEKRKNDYLQNSSENTEDSQYVINEEDGITYIDGTIIVNKSYSLPSSYVPENIVIINNYVKIVDYVKEAFEKLAADALSLGLNIYPSSGYRSYADQEKIYNNYIMQDGIEKADTYSARAGYSEHQTGLVIDVNTVDMTFDNTPESNWLKNNCYRYGFIIRYPEGKEDITGYMYEPWHIRYVGPSLAKTLYNNGNWLTIEEYYQITSKYK